MSELVTSIKEALVKLKNKQAPYHDSILVKEIRNAHKITNKKNSTIRIEDLEQAVRELEDSSTLHISIHLDSVNNILIKNALNSVYLNQEDKHNRQRSEKSMVLLTESDFKQNNKSQLNHKHKRPRLNFDDE